MYDAEGDGFDFTETYDGGTTYVHEDGEGAKTSGVKYNRASISEVCKPIMLIPCSNYQCISNHNIPGKESWERCNRNTMHEI